MESYCSFMIIIKGLELLFSIHNIAVNDFKMFTVSCTTTWPNCILILSRILKKQSKIELLLCHNVYDDVTDFEVCWFNKKHKKYIYLENKALYLLTLKKFILRAVPVRGALSEKWNAFFSTKNSKNTCCLGGCSVLNALILEKWGVKTHNSALLLDFLAFFWLYRRYTLVF